MLLADPKYKQCYMIQCVNKAIELV